MITRGIALDGLPVPELEPVASVAAVVAMADKVLAGGAYESTPSLEDIMASYTSSTGFTYYAAGPGTVLHPSIGMWLTTGE